MKIRKINMGDAAAPPRDDEAKKNAEKNAERKSLIYDKVISLGRIEMAVNIGKTILTRYSETRDPIIRHTLFLDKFQLLIDVMLGMATTDIMFDEFDLRRRDPGIDALEEYSNLKIKETSVKNTISEVSDILKEEMRKLSDYIQKDLYSLDNDSGTTLTKKAESKEGTKKSVSS